MGSSEEALIEATNVYACCMLAIMLWDCLTSLCLEYRVIWRARWGLVKSLYLFCRYGSIGIIAFLVWSYYYTFSYETCRPLVFVLSGVSSLITMSTEGILAVRAYAICGKPKWLLFVIITLLIIESAILAWSTAILQPLLPPGVEGACIPVGVHGQPDYLYFVAPFIVDTILTVIVFIRCRQINKAGYATNIVRVFLRDGFVYFAVVASANLIAAIFSIQHNAALKGLNAGPALSFSSIMCCRLVLSLRSMSDANNRSCNISGMPGGGTQGRSAEKPSTGVYRSALQIALARETVIAIDEPADEPVSSAIQRPELSPRRVTLPSLPYDARLKRATDATWESRARAPAQEFELSGSVDESQGAKRKSSVATLAEYGHLS